jgi:hypothetical protein
MSMGKNMKKGGKLRKNKVRNRNYMGKMES